ncbi:MAG TPA: threonine--tRNA ligase [Candidatus Omnitrophica bacterium]|nr:MAG: threonine--tRNA ligase [Omnitrophica WOR_2 bacterium GWA2_63_20]OGX32477.1 MAG: threonine--tRNA ligase [Omnitrophica WOR_2 bacterium RIFCSPHIGHO2_12_FULL_64_13]OGX36212.1 MAG: threonine--tRNA ligase [Omnitrophica WOR_2 bacterium RIFCSPHIGHO2_02_FULL_63_39]OGX45621.1 MAG: threonine--tRNA ligase [Omnitrophica WOR_2 bacterium RIFCSPLOWO2_02_FULL_63_16]OGX48504.1 MAG: threonine--tRNA ligase [Omnitrophica WOR_2 bacterium RIFCSPLOWO2_12_FULL_63_16]HBH97733.1 threonine--tRNA ligase [Candidatu
MGHAGSKEALKQQDEKLFALRHSAAHVMAQAVKRLYPQVKLAIGPPIEDGFYYDLDLPMKLTEEDLPKVEAEMAKIIHEHHPFQQSFMTKSEALTRFAQQGERFKVELIEGIADTQVSLYTDGEFVDLCEGPHVASTGEVTAFKLLALAGAYWRGDEHNPQLQRIYGTAYFHAKDLEAHLQRLEEAKRRDHRKLGRELGLFSFEELAGPGVVFYHPKGARVRWIIEDYIRSVHLARGYQPVGTPHIFRTDIWRRSGHLEYYQDYMFLFEAEKLPYGIKPMNCPGHILIFASGLHSYRELPIRLFELGTVYRNEKSGVLHGLLRVRGFTQDDAHIFLREDQLVEEINEILDFAFEVLRAFGFAEYEVELSTRPEKFIGTPSSWEHAQDALRRALEAKQIPYVVREGEGAFYGPKIDLKINDALGRSWQCGTIQCDFALPERFDLTYVGQDGKPHRVVMLHRALLGSFERFFGMLLEHYAGALPMWLSPVQAVVIPLTDQQGAYAQPLAARLREAGLRVDVDTRNEKMQAKIRDAQLAKIPYMLVVGAREATQQTVAVRHRRDGDVGAMSINQAIDRLSKEAAIGGTT